MMREEYLLSLLGRIPGYSLIFAVCAMFAIMAVAMGANPWFAPLIIFGGFFALIVFVAEVAISQW